MGLFGIIKSVVSLPFKTAGLALHEITHPVELVTDLVKAPFHILANPLTAPLGVVAGALTLDPNKVWAAATGDTKRIQPQGGDASKPSTTAAEFDALTKERQEKYGAVPTHGANGSGGAAGDEYLRNQMAAARMGGNA